MKLKWTVSKYPNAAEDAGQMHRSRLRAGTPEAEGSRPSTHGPPEDAAGSRDRPPLPEAPATLGCRAEPRPHHRLTLWGGPGLLYGAAPHCASAESFSGL